MGSLQQGCQFSGVTLNEMRRHWRVLSNGGCNLTSFRRITIAPVLGNAYLGAGAERSWETIYILWVYTHVHMYSIKYICI